MYADNFRVLRDVAKLAFGEDYPLVRPGDARPAGKAVVTFGKPFGRELRLPSRNRRAGYFVDWVLALLDGDELLEFSALEIQTIDTTGNYRKSFDELRLGLTPSRFDKAGLNWENVNKRILPQIIYKGHVLRRERLCKKGLFFACPAPVYSRVRTRLGANLAEYANLQPGSLTFLWYGVGDAPGSQLVGLEHFSTTVDQVANAFVSPTDLPDANVYEAALRQALISPAPAR